MPRRGGRLDKMELSFVQHYARTGDGAYAAEKAGYAHPAQASAKNLAKPDIREAAARRNAEIMQTELVPMALDCLGDVLAPANVEKYSVNARLKAADTVLKHARGTDSAADAKDLSEMTALELNAFITASQARIAELEGQANTIEHEPQEASEPGIFG